MYKIKPLEWEKTEHNYSDVDEIHEAHTPICKFEVEKWIGTKDNSRNWSYRYCFDEYYDDGGGSCKNLEDGKAKCEKIWTERIKKCLIEKETL